jgi:CheY-like chemotaxis protein
MQRVLMIDDDKQVSAVLAMALETLGHEVVMLNDSEGAEALCAKVKPDLILLDMMMPGRSGIDLVVPLSKICPDSVICIMTGLVDNDLLARSLSAGAWNILYKPYSLAELSDLVNLSELLTQAVRQEQNETQTQDSELKLHWPGDQRFSAEDLSKLVHFAHSAGAGPDIAGRRLPVVAAELLANAQVHGVHCLPDQKYSLTCVKDNSSLTLDIRDSGASFNWNRAVSDSNSRVAGGSAPGLQLVRTLADKLSFSEQDKTVHAVFNI